MTASEQPLVSVVVPTRNSAAFLGACLSSVRGQDYPAIELVVVDNHSDDGTAELAATYADRVETWGPERSAQRNRGIELSTGEYVLWIDSDMVLSQGVVSSAVEAALAADADAVFVPERSIGTGFWAACRILERRCYEGEPMIEAPRLVKRSFFVEHGGFVAEVAGQEDAELRMRLLTAHAVMVRSTAEIEHDEGHVTLRGVIRKRVYYGASIPAYAAVQPGAVRAQGAATVRALARNWRLLASEPVHGVGVLGLRSIEGAAYTYGALRSRRRPSGTG
jgi:GT2 family glycosyltransferase